MTVVHSVQLHLADGVSEGELLEDAIVLVNIPSSLLLDVHLTFRVCEEVRVQRNVNLSLQNITKISQFIIEMEAQPNFVKVRYTYGFW